jgi:hypothetical protein
MVLSGKSQSLYPPRDLVLEDRLQLFALLHCRRSFPSFHSSRIVATQISNSAKTISAQLCSSQAFGSKSRYQEDYALRSLHVLPSNLA